MFGFFGKKQFGQGIKTLGQAGEEAAQKEYQVRGFEILAANFFNRTGKRLGEVDFVARSKDAIIFVEVKTRAAKESRFGTGAEAVDVYKQRKLLKAVKLFLLNHQEYAGLRPQIDVCLVEQSPFDKSLKCAKIITNAVEDEN